MKKLTILVVFIGLALSLILGATPVYAQPPLLPHAFYGTVEINGSSAPVGTSVEARGEGVTTGIAGNPTYTTVSGIYGTSNPFEHRLIVQGDIDDGATITFYVNGRSTGQTAEWHNGETTELPLSVTITEPSEPSAPPPPTIETSIFGIEGSFPISDEGVIEEEIVAASEDENVTIAIAAGTIALLEGEPLETLTTVVESSPPEPPEGTYLIGAYDFGPDGATFDPPLTMTWSYDPETVPEGMEPIIAYYDEVNEEWVYLPVEVINNTLTALVSNFTTFAIITVPVVVAPPVEVEVPPVEEEEEEVITVAPAAFSVSYLSVSRLEVEPSETVIITVLVANTGGESGSYTVVLKIDGVKEAEETVTITASGSETVTFSVTKNIAGTYTVNVNGLSGTFIVKEVGALIPAPAKAINWLLIGGIIAGVVVVGLLVYFFVRRRLAY